MPLSESEKVRPITIAESFFPSVVPGVVSSNWLFSLPFYAQRSPAPFISHLLEVTRAGGQGEPDDGIAAVVVAGKNRDPARAFRGAEAEGKAEEQHCASGRIFLHRPFCAVKDRSSSASAEVESSRAHLDTATNGKIVWRSAGLRHGVFCSGSRKGAVSEAGAPVAVSRCAQSSFWLPKA